MARNRRSGELPAAVCKYFSLRATDKLALLFQARKHSGSLNMSL